MKSPNASATEPVVAAQPGGATAQPSAKQACRPSRPSRRCRSGVDSAPSPGVWPTDPRAGLE